MSGGNGHKPKALHFTQPPRRVVSLVPSLTESLFDLGLGEAVVGVTDYCTRPAPALSTLPRLGGPKNPRIAEIINLKPDLVLANWEENTQPVVEALEAEGVAVWVTFPKSVNESMEVLWTIVNLFRSQPARLRMQTLTVTLDWAASAALERRPVRCFCPIWYEEMQDGQPWWMTFNHDTYCHDLLALCGGFNVFAERERRYPLAADLGLEPAQDSGEGDKRYPRLAVEEIRRAQPELVLLPDEPFVFDETHRQRLCELLPDIPAVQQGRIHFVDGSLITWHGTRLAHALRQLPPLFEGGTTD